MYVNQKDVDIKTFEYAFETERWTNYINVKNTNQVKNTMLGMYDKTLSSDPEVIARESAGPGGIILRGLSSNY